MNIEINSWICVLCVHICVWLFVEEWIKIASYSFLIRSWIVRFTWFVSPPEPPTAPPSEAQSVVQSHWWPGSKNLRIQIDGKDIEATQCKLACFIKLNIQKQNLIILSELASRLLSSGGRVRCPNRCRTRSPHVASGISSQMQALDLGAEGATCDFCCSPVAAPTS